jgi:hypothetical protein
VVTLWLQDLTLFPVDASFMIFNRKNKMKKLYLIPLVLYSSLVCSTTINSTVPASNRDAEEKTTTNATNYKSSDLEMVDKPSYSQIVGVSFQLNVPQGSTINEAKIQFTANNYESSPASLVINGELVANSEKFRSSSSNISSRMLTNTSVNWQPGTWSSGQAGSDQLTPDLSSIVQEIVNQGSWTGGNYITFIIDGTGTRVADSWDYDSGITAAVLSVTYGETGGPLTGYFVDTNNPVASDSNPGTEQLPFKTIVHAATIAQVGDNVYVKAGTYDNGVVEIANSGTSGNPITFTAYPGDEHLAILETNGFHGTGVSYINVNGFKIQNIDNSGLNNGIRFEGPIDPYDPPATDISITNNHIYNVYSSCVSIWGVDWGNDPGDYDNIRNVIIDGNLIELCTNGGKNECITVANGAINIEVKNNEIRTGDPTMTGGDEGIDFKEGVQYSSIHDNIIHHLSDKAIYLDGGTGSYAGADPQVHDIDIYNNVMYNNPSSGMTITTEGLGDTWNINIFNNISYNNLKDGILVYAHPGGVTAGGTVHDVFIINNTSYKNGYNNGANGSYGGFRQNHPTATNIIFRNNIGWNNQKYDMRGDTGSILDHNLCRETSLCGETITDPLFIDTIDFLLQSTSPAIDAGSSTLAPSVDINGISRPFGSELDLGATEWHN